VSESLLKTYLYLYVYMVRRLLLLDWPDFKHITHECMKPLNI